MTTSTATSKSSRSESPPDGGRYDQFIEQRLDKTRVQVKLVDLAGATMVLAAGVLGVLLVLAIIDHWVISLGAWGRWLSLAGLVGGVAWYVTRTIVPLAFGQISSVYAARTIEKSEPSLKNSLINFLMFRSDRAGLRASVYQALRHQAAADLSHVQVETAVDRAKLIRIGYVLAGVLALCAAYAILSPRSTFQSAFRIIAPWADVDRPSRVRIEDVQPGNKEVYHGESVGVSATCYDVRESEPVTLFYSTLDGGVSRESVEMQPADEGLIYRCPLAPGGDGIQRDLVYWIEAGDARSPAYRLTVLPAPTVLVERIEYDYPAYTGQSKRIVERHGDVKGLEGTRVTVHASANVAIQSAVIEFDPSEVIADDEGQAAAPESAVTSSSDPERLELDFEGQRAWGSFVLELDATRTRPKRSFYRIRFSTEDGTQNPFPVLHRIEVTRDLSPEVEILTPTRDRIEVAEDGEQKIEVRGIDPDYGLSKITLRAVAGGHDVTTATLLDDPAGQTGQTVVGYAFKPKDHGLRAGDAVAYWAAAEDNRTLPGTEDPAPNTAKTRTYHLIIVPSEEQSGPENQNPDQEEPEPDLSSPPSHPQETAPPDATNADDGNTEPMEGEGQEGDQSGGQSGGEGNQASSDPSGSESGGSEQDGTGGQGSGTDANAETASGTGASDGGQQIGDSGTAGETASDGSTGEGSEGSTGGSAAEGGEGTTDGGQSGQPGSSGSGQTGSGGKPGSQQQATPSETGAEPTGEGAYGEEPLHDGEAFEKALEHMREQQGGDSADASSGGQAGGKPESGDASSGSQSPQGRDGGGAKDSPQEGGADGSAGGGQQQAGQPKPQDGEGSEASGAAQQQEGKPQDEPGAPKGGQQKSDASQGAGQKKEGASGSSGKPEGGAQPKQGKKPSNSGAGKPKDSGQGDSGDSGSGQSGQEKSGSAGAQQENRDQQKKKGSQSGKPKPGGGSQSPSHSQRQSDSSGGQEGDRSGGGKQGGGQGAKQQGNDSAGSNSPGDEGAGASSESGAGDESNQPGDRAPSEGKTGTPGVQKGQGSDTDPAPGGKGQGGTADGLDQAESTETVSGSPTSGATDERGQGVPMGGGKPSNAELRGLDLTGEVPAAEKPNLKYAREATNLVLDYLKEQQDAPNQELLDRLGWTDDQMRDFISRWESMKNAAVEDKVGERQLDEALRSLGLRPRRGTTRHVESLDDESRGLRDAGGQSSPPPGYEEQFKAFKKGTARTGGN